MLSLITKSNFIDRTIGVIYFIIAYFCDNFDTIIIFVHAVETTVFVLSKNKPHAKLNSVCSNILK